MRRERESDEEWEWTEAAGDQMMFVWGGINERSDGSEAQGSGPLEFGLLERERVSVAVTQGR